MGNSTNKNFIVVIFALIVITKCEIPEYIHVCPKDHQDLSGCIINSIKNLRSRLKVGIPELGIPPLEPFKVDPLKIDSLGSATRIATNLTNLQVWGASDFEIIKLTPKITKKGRSFRYLVKIPHLRLDGEYEIDSKLLFVNLQGKGPFNTNITNYQFECIMKGDKVERNGAEYLLFEPLKCNIGLEHATIYLHNLFNGNQLLGNATNAVLNDNSDIFFEEIKPGLEKAIEERFTEMANKITLAFKYDELFP